MLAVLGFRGRTKAVGALSLAGDIAIDLAGAESLPARRQADFVGVPRPRCCTRGAARFFLEGMTSLATDSKAFTSLNAGCESQRRTAAASRPGFHKFQR